MSIFTGDDSTSQGNFSTDLSSGKGNSIDRELQEFLLVEKQKAQINAQIHEFNDVCWEKCFTDKPKSKLDNKMETCLNNCLNRFIDVTLFVTNRFATTLQKSAKM